MRRTILTVALGLVVIAGGRVDAHPPWGIVVDPQGRVLFADIDHGILDTWPSPELMTGHVWSEDYFHRRRHEVFNPDDERFGLCRTVRRQPRHEDAANLQYS